MSPKVKLALTGVNIFCLVLTIITPSSTTFLSIFPALIAAMSWLFVSQKNPLISEIKQFLYIIIYMIAIIICAFLAITADIVPAASDNSVQIADTSVAAVGEIANSSNQPADNQEDLSGSKENSTEPDENADGLYLLKFRSGILLLSNQTVCYTYFAVLFGGPVVGLMIIEVFYDIKYHFNRKSVKESSTSLHKKTKKVTKYIK